MFTVWVKKNLKFCFTCTYLPCGCPLTKVNHLDTFLKDARNEGSRNSDRNPFQRTLPEYLKLRFI